VAELLQVNNLKTYFNTLAGVVKAVDGISYYIKEQEVVGLVGESGCGKSVSQLSVMQLIQSPPGKIVGGEIIFEGQNLLKYKSYSEEMCDIRGGKIAMIFQEPMTSLNPVFTIGAQLIESMVIHLHMSHQAAKKRAIELLELMGIPNPRSRVDDYPHQFSGGMRQRVMIAMALSCNPKMLIADEPTTALDVTTQAQLLEVMADMVKKFKTSLVLVTHNLGVVARHADRVYVMYAGHIVEAGTSEDVFGDPRHPYTKALLHAVPRLDEPKRAKLDQIPGILPQLINMPPICGFKPRCAYAKQCKAEGMPGIRKINEHHHIECHLDIKGEST
jgi:oligopeptide/dipeptide ABC transporter ATP-binding protein